MEKPDRVIADLPALADALVSRLVRVCRAAAEARGTAHLAVTGGSLLTHLGPALRAAPLPWDQLRIYFGDERAVGPTHPDSNYNLARHAWLDHVAIAPSRIHRMEAEGRDLTLAASRYEEVLRTWMGPVPRFDAVLLGAGADGHVCSLFTGHPVLGERGRLVAAVLDSPKPPPQRLTVTLAALDAARALFVFALGSEKAPALRTALCGANPEASPLAHVLAAAPSVVFLDHAAASLIET